MRYHPSRLALRLWRLLCLFAVLAMLVPVSGVLGAPQSPNTPAAAPIVAAPAAPDNTGPTVTTLPVSFLPSLAAITASQPQARAESGEPTETFLGRRQPPKTSGLPLPLGAEAPIDPLLAFSDAPSALPTPIVNFEGVSNRNGVYPPDSNGDVGPNHYFEWVNLSFQIFNKQGTSLYGPTTGNTLFRGMGGVCETTNYGDPIVLYDNLADRWFATQFSVNGGADGYHQCFAVSATGDPLGAWNRYDWKYSDTLFNDYGKFGVWPDAYYMTSNDFIPPNTWAGTGVAALERAAMLAGGDARVIHFELNNPAFDAWSLLPSDLDGQAPPLGSPNIFAMIMDAGSGNGWTQNAMAFWNFHVDWTTPSNSTFGDATNLPNSIVPVAPFTYVLCNFSYICLPQPGTTVKLDSLSDRLMFRLQYRWMDGHYSLVTNHTVSAGDTPDHAAIRWYEFRGPSSGFPYLYQQGTFAPDALNRWMASAAMDKRGNIAVGYSVTSASLYPSIRYTGRLANAPLGTLSSDEVTLVAGTGSQTGPAGRWGDYSMMSVDPTDESTFWYVNEYISTTGTAPWRTRIGSFKFPDPLFFLPLLYR